MCSTCRSRPGRWRSSGWKRPESTRVRSAPADEDEWWSCGLDCEPESVVAGLRWHCRDSYVLAPPSRFADGVASRWLRSPQEHPLPDALRPLEYLVDACEA